MAIVVARALAFAALLMLPLIFKAMDESGWLDLVGCWLIFLGRLWSCDSSVAILCSNRCKSLSSSSIFIIGESESRPIMYLMRLVVEAYSQRFIFGFGGSSSLVFMFGSVGLVFSNSSVKLVCFLVFHRF